MQQVWYSMRSSSLESYAMNLSIRQLHPVFVGEVSGIDLRRPIDDVTVQAIVQASDRYAVLVFPDQALDDEQQLAFSARLGPLETTIRKLRPGHQLRLNQHVSDISNLDHTGAVLARDDRQRMYSLGDRLWHTDSSFKSVPAKYSLLSGRAIPATGGETQFADLRAAYDALPDSIKARLEGLVAEHSIVYSRSTIGFTDFSDEERAALSPVPQVLVRVHPGSKRKTLYLASHAMAIRGMPLPEARLLLRDLMDHATQPQFVYTHRWRLGDLVMWDDRCTMHRAREFDPSERRDMHRTTVSDVASTLEQG
jgi:alpha-ketoglutarate-dependent 2,4-dichlorophenoxyacetate dioxygenase